MVHDKWVPNSENRVKLGHLFMAVHVQTKDDNWNFSSAKVETFVTLFELRPHIQINSIIFGKLLREN